MGYYFVYSLPVYEISKGKNVFIIHVEPEPEPPLNYSCRSGSMTSFYI